MERLLRFRPREYVAPCCTNGGPHVRVSSPSPGRSTFTTSAPRSPSVCGQWGPASRREKSATSSPSRAPGAMAQDSSLPIVRTVVVSDLHLGSRSEGDVLRRRVAREKLLERVEGADRLVLLGDTVELRQGPAREAMAIAQPVLEELGGALGDGGEVVLVPGNHDHALVAPWLERRGAHVEPAALGLEEHPGADASAATEAIAQWMAPATLIVAYPGVWLRDDVYATHGHYLDRHTTVPTFERLGAGIMGRLVGTVPEQDAKPDDYEAALAPLYAWMHAMAERSSMGRRRPPSAASAE